MSAQRIQQHPAGSGREHEQQNSPTAPIYTSTDRVSHSNRIPRQPDPARSALTALVMFKEKTNQLTRAITAAVDMPSPENIRSLSRLLQEVSGVIDWLLHSELASPDAKECGNGR